MYENQQRIDEFRAELSAMRTKSSRSASADRRLLVLSILLMIGGLVAIVVGYIGAADTNKDYEAVSYLISGGILGLALVVIGVGLFIRYSLGGFMRFWLARLIYEQQAQTDRLLSDGGPAPEVTLVTEAATVIER